MLTSRTLSRPRRDAVLFLDFDGVLNSSQWIDRVGADVGVGGLDPAAVALLAEIVDRTNASIVVSSTWRIGRSLADLRQVLIAAGYPSPCPVIDKTDHGGSDRGAEIQRWLGAHRDVKRFCILDDDSDMGALLPYLVQTSWKRGLEREHAERCVEMLNRSAGL